MIELKLYIDVLFAVNLIMNLVIMLIVRWIRKQKTSYVRLLLSAAAGAFASCLAAVFMNGPLIISFLIEYAGVGALMTWIAFGVHGKRIFLSNQLCLFICTFILGGAVEAVLGFMGRGYNLRGFYHNVLFNTTTIGVLFIISAILTPIIYYIISLAKENKKTERIIYDVMMYLDDTAVCCKGLMDTGNCLCDPILGWPVIVVDKLLLAEELKKAQIEKPAAFCVIPYHSVGQENGLLYGLRLNRVVISNANEEICTEHVVAALSDHGFANQKEYRALLHEDLLNLRMN